MQGHIEKQLEAEKLPRLPLDMLYDYLTDYGLDCGWDFKRVYRWYKLWKAHGILPFTGGTAEQPETIWDDFDRFELIEMTLSYPQQVDTPAVDTDVLKEGNTDGK